MPRLKFLAFTIIVSTLIGCIQQKIELTSSIGALTGIRSNGADIYYGIPYAEPPTGSNRWQAPIAKAPFSSSTPFNATSARPGCIQGAGLTGVFQESENCLYLNVFKPSYSSTPLPVMVWLHGGSFTIGSGTEKQYNAEDLAKNQKVIVVTLNYRLGFLGHLSIPELTAESNYGGSGNYAFLDQLMAMQWVNDNIASFGGDASNITLFGESAGAASVCMHLATPLATGLFQKSIIQSGNCEWITRSQSKAETQGQDFVKAYIPDCWNDSNQTTDLSCLRSKNATSIRNAVKSANPDANALSFDPVLVTGGVIDNYFLTDTARNLINGSKSDIPVIIGVTKDEGTIFHSFEVPLTTNTEYANYINAKYPSIDGDVSYQANASDILNTHYPVSSYSRAINALSDVDGDHTIACPARWTADKLADNGHDVFFYEFRTVNQTLLFWFTEIINGFDKGPDLGAFHSSDVPFVFGASSVLGNPENSTSTKNVMQQYWGSFAANGIPTSQRAENEGLSSWPNYRPGSSATDRAYVKIQSTPTADFQLKQDKCDFWENHKTQGFFNL